MLESPLYSFLTAVLALFLPPKFPCELPASKLLFPRVTDLFKVSPRGPPADSLPAVLLRFSLENEASNLPTTNL